MTAPNQPSTGPLVGEGEGPEFAPTRDMTDAGKARYWIGTGAPISAKLGRALLQQIDQLVFAVEFLTPEGKVLLSNADGSWHGLVDKSFVGDGE